VAQAEAAEEPDHRKDHEHEALFFALVCASVTNSVLECTGCHTTATTTTTTRRRRRRTTGFYVLGLLCTTTAFMLPPAL
jgi:hypothetical protein